MMKIKSNRIIIFILLLLSTNLDIFNYMNSNVIKLLEEICRAGALICAIILYLYKRNLKISPIFAIVFVMQTWLFFATLINQGNILGFFLSYVPPIFFAALIVESMRNSLDDFIESAMTLGEILCYTNFILVLIFPNGIYSTYTNSFLWYSTKNWLLGNRNIFISYLLFFDMIAFLYRYHGGKRWREWGIYIISLFSVIFVKSATSTVGLILLLVLFLVIKWRKIEFSTYLFTAINVAMFFLIVIFRMQDIFSFVIEDLLGKNLTLSGRTVLWDAVIRLIKAKPIYGYGVPEPGFFQYLLNLSYAGHAHNLILNYLSRGGLVYLGLYFVLFGLTIHQLYKVQARIEAQCIIAVLFVFQIMGLSEPFENNAYVYMIYFIAYNVKYLLRTSSRKEIIPSNDLKCAI